jgi:hypothetical protein
LPPGTGSSLSGVDQRPAHVDHVDHSEEAGVAGDRQVTEMPPPHPGSPGIPTASGAVWGTSSASTCSLAICRRRPGTEGFLDGIVESWVAPVADALVKAGADERTARADARLSVAVVRGLLLDLLATGDRAGVGEAYERFLARTPAFAAPAPHDDGEGSLPDPYLTGGP